MRLSDADAMLKAICDQEAIIPVYRLMPDGHVALCLLALRCIDGEATSAEVRDWLRMRGARLTSSQVCGALWWLSRRQPPLVELTERRMGSGRPAVWQLTERGRIRFNMEEEP